MDRITLAKNLLHWRTPTTLRRAFVQSWRQDPGVWIFRFGLYLIVLILAVDDPEEPLVWLAIGIMLGRQLEEYHAFFGKSAKADRAIFYEFIDWDKVTAASTGSSQPPTTAAVSMKPFEQ